MASFPGIPGWLAAPLASRLTSGRFTARGKTAYRAGARKTDVLTIQLVGKPLCRKWNVAYGALMMEPACFLPFVPSRERADFQCCQGANVRPSSYLECQIRFAVRRGIPQPEVARSFNLWFVDLDRGEQPAVLEDMLRVLDQDVLPFFASVEDLGQFQEYLRSGDDNTGKAGIWNIGKPASFRRLFLLGFTALEAGDWEEARQALNACSAVAEAKSLKLPPPVLECVRHAAELAQQHQRLPGSTAV